MCTFRTGLAQLYTILLHADAENYSGIPSFAFYLRQHEDPSDLKKKKKKKIVSRDVTWEVAVFLFSESEKLRIIRAGCVLRLLRMQTERKALSPSPCKEKLLIC